MDYLFHRFEYMIRWTLLFPVALYTVEAVEEELCTIVTAVVSFTQLL